jgi:hypothetical protein
VAEPDTLLIPYEDFECGRFTHVGRYGGGNQFMGYVTYASSYVPKFYDTEEVTPEGQLLLREHTNCFAVLHRFDAAGRHLGTDVERVEGTRDSGQRDWAKLAEMIAGLATKSLHKIGIEYGDISYIAWAYEQEVPRTGLAVGHAADVAPPLPWPDRQSALRRNQEMRRIWEQRRQGGGGPLGQNTWEQTGDIGGVQAAPGTAADRPRE